MIEQLRSGIVPKFLLLFDETDGCSAVADILSSNSHAEMICADIPRQGLLEQTDAVILCPGSRELDVFRKVVDLNPDIPVFSFSTPAPFVQGKGLHLLPWGFLDLPSSAEEVETIVSSMIRQDLLLSRERVFMRRVAMNSEPENLDDLRVFLRENLSGLLVPDLLRNIIAALFELTDNAMQHGNKRDPEKRVYVQLFLDAKRFAARVTDEGEGFNFRKYLQKIDTGDNIKLALKKGKEQLGGLGLPMAKRIFDVVDFKGKGNTVYVQKRFVAVRTSGE